METYTDIMQNREGLEEEQKIRQKVEKKWKYIISGAVLLFWYTGGFLAYMIENSAVTLNPVKCFGAGLSAIGIKCMILTGIVLIVLTVVISMKGREGTAGEDVERNFAYSNQGTYGTAGFMSEEEREKVLAADKDIRKVDGIILGSSLEDGKIISLPKDSRLNRNFAVCGSQGSMKSRAFARNMILQCVKRGESMFITDPKSELYEDTAYYLEQNGYLVKQYNLIHHECSDAWDCLAEIDGSGVTEDLGDINGELIDVFVDVVIRNTTDKFDHFYDNTEMDLLKALCLYVYHEYAPGHKTFAEAYKLLLYNSLEKLDAIFENLPLEHPARGPYQLFAKAEKVKGNAVLGLGTRLQIMQNKKIRILTSTKDIDLELPGKQKCAYFCITSDQDSTYDMLATLLVSFLFIKLVRLADMQTDRKLPVPMYMILDEMPNIGVIPGITKKVATARSRGIGVCMLFQNLPQFQNRYPDNQWEELLGGCDTSLFLGCNDMTTATYYSERSGDVTVGVSTVRKSLHTLRITDYVPEYGESFGVGKRKLLLPDEIMRFPVDEALVIVRGQKVLRVKKVDYTKNPEAKKFKGMKAVEHVPEWRKRPETEYGEMFLEIAEKGKMEDEKAAILRLEDLF